MHEWGVSCLGFQGISVEFAEPPVRGNLSLLKTYGRFILKYEMGKKWNSVTHFIDIPKIKEAFKHDELIIFLVKYDTMWNTSSLSWVPRDRV